MPSPKRSAQRAFFVRGLIVTSPLLARLPGLNRADWIGDERLGLATLAQDGGFRGARMIASRTRGSGHLLKAMDRFPVVGSRFVSGPGLPSRGQKLWQGTDDIDTAAWRSKCAAQAIRREAQID